MRFPLVDNLLVIGMGLIGGSVLKAAREAGTAGRLLGMDRDLQTVKKALAMGIAHQGGPLPQPMPPGKNLIVLATHLDSFREKVEELLPHLTPETVVTDVGSVKAPIVEELTPILATKGIPFVGSHPIAGTEKSGVENSIKDLFIGARVIITPTTDTPPEALNLLKTFWQALGARVEEMDPQHHDTVFAAVSHLPHAVTYALVKTMGDAERELGDLLRFSGGGFKDFTRIAASNPHMWREIFRLNRNQILSFLRRFNRTLEEMEGLMEKGKWKELEGLLEEARWLRRGLD